ncbi:MAG TPA: T9SS type A sorting domain-containing protein [Candidatus Kapabacteria bacterium]|nr:T9SS type A sorting domain-containing protein [Candidatus Kapabacteria bacterium]
MSGKVLFPGAVRAILSIVLLSILVVPASMMHAQRVPQLDPAASGTYFMVVFPDTVHNALDVRYPNNRVADQLTLWMFSPTGTRVTVITGSGGVTVVQLAGGAFTEFKTSAFSPVTAFNQISRNSLRVIADTPIVLYCYLANAQSLETWTPISVTSWGAAYRVAALPGATVDDIGTAGITDVPGTPKPAPGIALVVAAHDSTQVTFHPAPGVRLLGNPSLTVTLNEGEAYQVASYVDTSLHAAQDDIGGMEITADKPVGVISGNTRTQTAGDSVIGQVLKGNAYKGLQMEWLAPIEQYGRRFVHTPTWDAYRSGLGSRVERKSEFVRIYNPANVQMNGSYRMEGDAASTAFTVAPGSSSVVRLASTAFGEITTDRPAQVMMHSTSAVSSQENGSDIPGVEDILYEGITGYMTTETPYEQWVSFAPYYAPNSVPGMLHYINVVTDSVSAANIVQEDGTPFVFSNNISGTGLVFGTMAVTPGRTHWLEGRNGARFAGTVYGVMKGREEYRPGHVTRKKDGGSQVAGAAANTPVPGEYEEYSALSYGYPLAPRRNAVSGPSSVTPIAPASGDYLLAAVRDGENVRIRYAFPEGLHGTLAVYDILGRPVAEFASSTAGAGDHSLVWNTRGVPAGTYYIALGTESGVRTSPIVVTR